MACYSKKLSTIVKASTISMLKYCFHKLGCKSPITKILNNRLGRRLSVSVCEHISWQTTKRDIPKLAHVTDETKKC
jgi:hypothetical protein